MDSMKELKVWECKWCKKLFKTPNRHCCKMNPAMKNCYTCKNLKGWKSGEAYNLSPCPDCKVKAADDYDLDFIKILGYNLKCESWEEGKYVWEYDSSKESGEGLDCESLMF